MHVGGAAVVRAPGRGTWAGSRRGPPRARPTAASSSLPHAQPSPQQPQPTVHLSGRFGMTGASQVGSCRWHDFFAIFVLPVVAVQFSKHIEQSQSPRRDHNLGQLPVHGEEK